ncbi:MAG: hypothetical protein ACMUIE_09270 [Thermoplasmatota archaeon]
MRKRRLLAVSMVLLLIISGNGLGRTHHEDYDDARLNEETIQLYIQTILEQIGSVLQAILEDDRETIDSEMSSILDSAEDVRDTLSRIPEEVDSYGLLTDKNTLLQGTVLNLSLVVSSYNDNAWSLQTLSNISISDWNLSSLRSRLFAISRAFHLLPRSNSLVKAHLEDLEANLREFIVSGYGSEEHLLTIREIGPQIENKSLESPRPFDVEVELVNDIAAHWSRDLTNISLEKDPGITLMNMTRTLGLALPEPTSVIYTSLKGISEQMGTASDSISSFRYNQTGFLTSMNELEDAGGSGLLEIYEIYISTYGFIINMTEEIDHQEEIFSWVMKYHIGGVDERISDLRDLVNDYESRYKALSLLYIRLQNLSLQTSLLQWMNVQYPDLDGSGELSSGELRNLTFPENILESILDLGTEKERTLGEIQSIGPPWDDILRELFLPLDTAVDSTLDLTRAHMDLVRDLKKLTEDPIRSSAVEKISLLKRAAGALATMEAEFSSMEFYSLEVASSDVGMDTTALDPIQALLSLYRETVANLSRELNLTGLYIGIDNRVVPYDGTITVRILLVTGSGIGPDALPTGERIDIYIDGMVRGSSTTTEGLAVFQGDVTRDMELGEHLIEVVHQDTGNRSNITFRVRKMHSYLYIGAPSVYIEPGRSVTVTWRVRDEFGRPVNGIVEYKNDTATVNGDLELDMIFPEHGEHEMRIHYVGDEWTETSNATMTFNVSYIPVINLTAENSTILLNDTINLYLELGIGHGGVSLVIDGNVTDLGTFHSPELRTVEMNASDLGPGFHDLKAVFRTHTNMVRDGESRILLLLVLNNWSDIDDKEENETEPPVIVDDDDDEEEPPIEEPDEEDDEEGPREEGLLVRVWKLIALAGTLLIVVILVFLVIRNRRVRKEHLKVVLPKVLSRRRIERTDEGAEEELQPTQPSLDPDLSRARKLLGSGETDKGREKVIVSYLKVLDSAPEGIGLSNIDTPREVGSKLKTAGTDCKTTDDLTEGFEGAIYRSSSPSQEQVERVDRSAGRIIRTFGSEQ